MTTILPLDSDSTYRLVNDHIAHVNEHRLSCVNSKLPEVFAKIVTFRNKDNKCRWLRALSPDMKRDSSDNATTVLNAWRWAKATDKCRCFVFEAMLDAGASPRYPTEDSIPSAHCMLLINLKGSRTLVWDPFNFVRTSFPTMLRGITDRTKAVGRRIHAERLLDDGMCRRHCIEMIKHTTEEQWETIYENAKKSK